MSDMDTKRNEGLPEDEVLTAAADAGHEALAEDSESAADEVAEEVDDGTGEADADEDAEGAESEEPTAEDDADAGGADDADEAGAAARGADGERHVVGRLIDEGTSYDVLLDEKTGEFLMSIDGHATPATHFAVRHWDENGHLVYDEDWQRVAVRACLASAGSGHAARGAAAGGGRPRPPAGMPAGGMVTEPPVVHRKVPARSLAVASAVAAGLAVVFPFALGWAAAPVAVILGIVAVVRNREERDRDVDAAAVVGMLLGFAMGLVLLASLVEHAVVGAAILGEEMYDQPEMLCSPDGGTLEVDSRGVRWRYGGKGAHEGCPGDDCDEYDCEDGECDELFEWKDLGSISHADGVDAFAHDMSRRLGGGDSNDAVGDTTMRQVPLADEEDSGIEQVPLADEDQSGSYKQGLRTA